MKEISILNHDSYLG